MKRREVWRAAAGVVSDGHELVVVPPVAVLAPVVTVLLAFVAGALQFGYETVVTESMLLVAVAVALGGSAIATGPQPGCAPRSSTMRPRPAGASDADTSPADSTRPPTRPALRGIATQPRVHRLTRHPVVTAKPVSVAASSTTSRTAA